MPSFPHRVSRLLAPFLAVAAGTVTGPAAADTVQRPTAVVAMGDSYSAGEGGGDYEPDSNRVGDYCHRSANAPINLAKPAWISTAVNLGCSAATTDDVRLDGTSRYGEPPQAEQLKTIARRYQVRDIVLAIGANDISTVNMVISCVLAFGVGGVCANLWDNLLPQRLKAIQPRIVNDLNDIRSVMRTAGYRDDSYELTLQSYASPSGGVSRYSVPVRALQGCPFQDADFAWFHQTGFPMISRYMRQAAASVSGVRFLDITSALQGRQDCYPGIDHDQEWMWGLFVDPTGLRIGPGPQLVAQSLHPNTIGYQHIAWCLRQFRMLLTRTTRCDHRPDGHMQLTAGT